MKIKIVWNEGYECYVRGYKFCGETIRHATTPDPGKAMLYNGPNIVFEELVRCRNLVGNRARVSFV